MSLKLLQKQVGQQSQERQSKIHGSTPLSKGRGRGAAWAKPKSSSSTSLGSGAAYSEEEPKRSSTVSHEADWRRDSPPPGSAAVAQKGGRGKAAGRGFIVDPLAEAAAARPNTAAEPATSSTAPPPSTVAQQTVEGQEEELGGVEGLREAMIAANLSQSMMMQADTWCSEQGAADLGEIVEALDDFSETLSLRPLERKRLEKALASAIRDSSSAGRGPGAEAQKEDLRSNLAAAVAEQASCRQGSEAACCARLREAIAAGRVLLAPEELAEAEGALARAEAAEELWAAIQAARQAPGGSADDPSLEGLSEALAAAAPVLGIEDTLVADASSLLEELRAAAAAAARLGSGEGAAGSKDEAQAPATEVDGLRAAFEEARLPHHADQACKWCCSRRLASSEAVVAAARELGDYLGLKPLEYKRLEKALDAMPSSLKDDAAVEQQRRKREEEKGVEEAAEEARRKRQEEEAKAREEASSALAKASAGKDVEALRKALRQATEAGVGRESVAKAEKTLSVLQEEAARAEAEEGLNKAADAKDIPALEAAVAKAEAAKMGDEVLAKHKNTLTSLKAAASAAKAREEASSTLAKASAGKDIDALKEALRQASDLGVASAVLAKAEKKLASLQDDMIRTEAETALSTAAESKDIAALEKAIAHAEAAKVGKKVLLERKRTLTSLQEEASTAQAREEASSALQKASAGKDIKALEAALRQADKTGVEKEALAEAEKKLTVLQEEAARTDAEIALSIAAGAEDILALEEALARAEAAKVGDKVLATHKTTLLSLQQEARAAQMREEASSALEKASAGKDINTLEQALQQAKDAAVGEEVLAQAGKRLKSLREEAARSEAEAALNKASGIAALEEALASAEAAGVGDKVLAKHKKTLASLQQEAEAAKMRDEASCALVDASEGKDIEALEKALQRAKDARVGKEALAKAQKKLESLQQEVAILEAEEALKKAAETKEDIAILEKELAKAEASKVADKALAALRGAAQRPAKAAVEAEASTGAGDETLAAIRAAQQAGDATALATALKGAEKTLAAIRAAQQAGDATALATALKGAEKAKIDPQELASAKKALFQLQKEKREKGKLERTKTQVAADLKAAVAGDDSRKLREALRKAREAGGTPVEELDAAQARLDALEEEERVEAIRVVLDDLGYAISQDDAEAAQLALEDAASMGASEEELKAAEEKLSELRMKLDPEGEARRRRVEARKAKSGEKKWNYAGKTDNKLIINDKFREHEAELERRRMLSYKGRGGYRGDAEDQGEEGAEKEVKKTRAEVNKEKGKVELPKLNEATNVKGFAWGRSPKEEAEAPRTLTLRAHLEMGAGVDLHACWWGMCVDSIDPEPGQPGLRIGDTITEVNGTSLRELESDDCEQRFADLFGDGCVVKVEPHVSMSGILAPQAALDKSSLQADLERFAADYDVKMRLEDADSINVRVIMDGPQSAVKACKSEFQSLMQFYVGTAS
eukprot:TRINITY_DN87230_c0_g1_i1.p1 TRINITY_DN87230_c0_g1~~TRINITY_DN87230_c0_g1_i1.p1  ORF type:complete len:1483 (-),score=502.31 TRINITY_DN87230_c0_g1_i1:37-4455(-)